MKTSFIKPCIIVALLSMGGYISNAQNANVGIGTTKPDQSAILDLSSSTKGFLLPRMTEQQRAKIENPAEGLKVYQTDGRKGEYIFDGTQWSYSVAGIDGDWTQIGNTGTNAYSNWIGTNDTQPLAMRVAADYAGWLDPSSRNLTFFGYLAGYSNIPVAATGSYNTAVGNRALLSNTTGGYNMGMGGLSLQNNTAGDYNMGVGVNALNGNTLGSYNVGVGAAALYKNNGTLAASSNNVAIGAYSAYNKVGKGNIYIGTNAGWSETTSAPVTEDNTLYIHNDRKDTPLVYGNFSAKYLAIGEVAIADRAAAVTGGYRLLVKGGMMTEKIKVAVAGSPDWADYVFDPSYKLMSLDKVEFFIKENKHLPNVPSADDMVKNGLDVTKTSAKLLEKIEELTLYMIEINKEIKALKDENAKLRNK